MTTIQPFDLKAAPDADHAALNAFNNALKAERLPDDPPTPLAQHIAGCRNIPDFVEVSHWAAWDGEKIVAAGGVELLKTDENRHVVQFGVDVLPAYRRQGIGRRLLAELVSVPCQTQRRLMITMTNERVPAGEAWMEKLGAERGLETHTNQLKLANLDHNLIRRWKEQAATSAAGFTLGWWFGPYPDDQLAAIVHLNEVMNTAPRDKLDVEDFHFTADHIRQMEQGMQATKTERWTVYARETSTGNLAGFTEVFWNPSDPEKLGQGSTGVFPEYRGHGLGRWLKAAMLDKVQQDRPEVKFVRTGNADSNAPMLKINQTLGFQPYFSNCVWQIETQRVLDYLAA